MPHYLDILAEFFPDAEAELGGNGDPTIYANLVWVTAPILQATLDQYDTYSGHVVFSPNNLRMVARNETGGAIAAGTPCYVVGHDTLVDCVHVAPCDAGLPAKMPSVGLAPRVIQNNETFFLIKNGHVGDMDTSMWSEGQQLYIAVGGGLTSTKPTGTANLIQKVAQVLKSDAVDGHIHVFGAGRANDLPNLTQDKVWMGGLNDVPEEVDIYDETEIDALLANKSDTTHSHVLNDLGNVSVPTPNVNDHLIFNGANWVNQPPGAGVGAYQQVVDTWTLDSGDLYYADVTHNLGTDSFAIFCFDNVTQKEIRAEDVEILSANAARVWVRGNTTDMTVNFIVGSGPPGSPGDDGTVWYNGSSAPSAGLGVVGDYYVNNTTGEYYEKTGATTWTLRGQFALDAHTHVMADITDYDDSGLVHIAGAETITGAKTFDEKVTITGTGQNLEIGFDTNFYIRQTAGGGYVKWMDTSNSPQWMFGSPTMTGHAYIDVQNGKDLYLQALVSGGIVIGNGGMTPESNGVPNIGADGNRFGAIWASSANTSGDITVGGNIVASIDALSDVDTTTSPPISGEALIWDGVKWAPSMPQTDVVNDTTPELGGDLNMNMKNIEYSLPTADLTYSGIIITATVDQNTVGFGGLLHLDTDGNFIDANRGSANTVPCNGIAVETGTGTKKIMLHGLIRKNSWAWTPGQVLFVDSSNGQITTTRPSSKRQAIGWALTADIIYFNPDTEWTDSSSD